MRKMKDSGVEWIGYIPEGWDTMRIKYLADPSEDNSFTDGDWIESTDITNAGIRYLTTGNVGDGSFKEQGDGYISDDTFRKLNCKYAYPNDLVISRLNSPYGRACILPDLYSEYVLAVDIVILRTKANKQFFTFVTQCSGYQRSVEDQAKGTTMKRISRTNLGNIVIPFPSILEQQKISGLLYNQCSIIDSIIEKTKASIEDYKKLKQAIITHAVTKGVRGNRPMKNTGIDWIGEIPDEWNVSKIRYIGKLQNGISKGSEFFGEGWPFVSYGDVYKNYSLPRSVSGLVNSNTEEQQQYSVSYGDIFFTRTSETIEEVGFSAVCEETIQNAVFAGFVIRLRPYNVDSKITTSYAKYYFRSEHIRKYLVKEMNLVTRASLGQTLLNSMIVLLPSKTEQNEIAIYLDSKCSELDELIIKKEKLIAELESYKKSTIYEYVTGKKEVPST